jgi:hypothetical protein
MNWILFFIFAALAVGMILPAFRRKDYRLQFPCLAGLTVLMQVALPMASLTGRSGELSDGAMTRFSVMAILCLIAAWTGYQWWKPQRRMWLPQFDDRRLAISALILVAFGGFFTLRLGAITPDIDPVTTNWTGIATVYDFFASVMRYGAVLAVILFFRTKDWKLLLLSLPQLWEYLVLFKNGRRSPTGEVIVVICVLMFFYRKWTVPLWAMVLGIFAMAVFCFNIGTIRATKDQPLSERIHAIAEANPLRAVTLEGMADDRNYVEIYNGANFMDSKAKGGHYTLGLHFWNALVFSYVPAQFLGRDFKQGLMINLTDDTTQTGFQKSNGTCETGIGEAFMAFGYFGCVLFFGLGAFMRWLWEGAVRNSILHQLMFMLCALGSVLAFNIQLWTFINAVLNITLFAGPLLWWSHSQQRQQSARPVSSNMGGIAAPPSHRRTILSPIRSRTRLVFSAIHRRPRRQF